MASKYELHFPCEFPIKVLGLANDEFEIAVLTIIRKHVKDLAENAITTRHSKDKKYISITIMINAQSKQQLDAIYQELSDEKRVIMAL